METTGQKPDQLNLQSRNTKAKQREKLKQPFPETFQHQNKLKATRGETADSDPEKYSMAWPGKKECFRIIEAPSRGTLKPCRSESLDWDTTHNVFVEGENLEVLKLFQHPYFNKIKLIYIDPPYNTGKEFIYPDKFSQTLETYLKYTGQKDASGQLFSTHQETDGRLHSNWINMMYPRLFLARNLLKEDGAVCISIDDHEVTNLRKICDEIFGEENFIATFVWTTKKGGQGMMTQNRVVSNHEYILVYGKNKEVFQFIGLDRKMEDFSNPDNDPRGPWKRQQLQRKGQGLPIRSVCDPKTKYVYKMETPYRQEKINQWIKEDRIIFPDRKRSDKTAYPTRKEFLNEYVNKKQLVTSLGLYPTKSSTGDLHHIFDEQKIFSNPKPDKLLQYLFKSIDLKNEIVLDFFAGSATTAHAIMQLNVEDGGCRKYICVQLPELLQKDTEAYRAGYKTIADIGKERIRRVAQKIKTENKQHSLSKDQNKLDLGFRVFKLDTSNFKIWEDIPKTLGPSEQIEMYLQDFIDPKSSDEDLLYEILMKTGFELTTPIQIFNLAGKTVYSVDRQALLVCLDRKLTRDVFIEMGQMKPARVVCLDMGFKDNDMLKINAKGIFESYKVKDFQTI